MTAPEVDESEGSNLAWFHCNECHRSFQNHNRVQSVNSSLRLLKSDLTFAFTSCGHVFCENCIRAHTNGAEQKFTCTVCRVHAHCYRLNGSVVPKKLEMYLQPPTTLIEDAFQLGNANELITGLRAKIGQQKELLGRAKQELAEHKKLRDHIATLEEENESLKKQLSIANRSGGSKSIGSPAISIKLPTPHRISIKSPSVRGTSNYPPHSHQLQPPPPKSPAMSEESYYGGGHPQHMMVMQPPPPGSFQQMTPQGPYVSRRPPSSSAGQQPSFYYGTPRQQQGPPMNYYSNDPFLSMAVNADSPSMRPMRPVVREYPRPPPPPAPGNNNNYQ